MDFTIPDHEKIVAVALSGGGDSMALAHMMCRWASLHGRTIHLLTVNHNLRPEAAGEAAQVGQWVSDFPNARHFILTWDFQQKPETAVMEQARQARYALMADHCRLYGIYTLAVAHHADDQLETFLFRLCKGSGLDGLTGMQEWSAYDGIKLYRPFLGDTHDELIAYCQNNEVPWIEDPSNENESYARPRLRKALAAEGLDAKRFARTLVRLGRAQSALEEISQTVYQKAACPRDRGMTVDWSELQACPLDIRIRVLQKILMQVGETANGYPPKLERVEEIVKTLQPDKSATLYGCELSLSKDGKVLEVKGSTP